jgi:hypothetical protein
MDSSLVGGARAAASDGTLNSGSGTVADKAVDQLRATPIHRRDEMPKGQQRSNREAKKPKQPKKTVVTGARATTTPTPPRWPVQAPGKKA